MLVCFLARQGPLSPNSRFLTDFQRMSAAFAVSSLDSMTATGWHREGPDSLKTPVGVVRNKGTICSGPQSRTLSYPVAQEDPFLAYWFAAPFFASQKLGIYNTSKTALLGLCKSLAVELAPKGICVNCIVPGITKTNFGLGVKVVNAFCSQSLPPFLHVPSGPFSGFHLNGGPQSLDMQPEPPPRVRVWAATLYSSVEEWGSFSSSSRLVFISGSHRGVGQPWCSSHTIISSYHQSSASHWLWNLFLGENNAGHAP